MKKIMIVLLTCSFNLFAGGGKSQPKPSLVEVYKVSKNALLVNVRGMVCDFCAQGLKKKFGAIDEVKEIDVDLESGNVLILLRNGKSLSEKKVKKAVEENGLEVVKISKK